MARCSVHGFENCPYHGALERTPVGAFRFCACFVNHDGKTACNCGCGQCHVYRQELADSPVASKVAKVSAIATPHPADECVELCAPRQRWVSQLQEIDTAASRSMIDELQAASTDVALLAGIDKAEIVYFGELDRLSSQRAAGKTAPQMGSRKQKKKSERGKPGLKCALCDVTHPRSVHLAEARSEARQAADAAIHDAKGLLGDRHDEDGGNHPDSGADHAGT